MKIRDYKNSGKLYLAAVNYDGEMQNVKIKLLNFLHSKGVLYSYYSYVIMIAENNNIQK